MKKLLLSLVFCLSAFLSFGQSPPPCGVIIDVSSMPTFLQPNSTYTMIVNANSVDVINGNGPLPSFWTASCTGCATFTITGGSVNGVATAPSVGLAVEITTDNTTQNISVIYSITQDGGSPCNVNRTFPFVNLPVEYASFEASTAKDGVDLAWTTSMELNNDYFTIERSFDGTDFTAVEKIHGAGDSDVEIDYTFTDKEVTRLATANTVYYRLKQTDFDGEYSYSDVLTVKLENRNALEVTNVALDADVLNVNFSAPVVGTTEVCVFDMTGRCLGMTELTAEAGFNTTTLALEHDAAGVLVVRITDGQNTAMRKFVK